MKIRAMSDLHLEFLSQAGHPHIRKMASNEEDVIVIAGDLTTCSRLYSTLKLLAEHLFPVPIIYVAGNHEYYGGSPEIVQTIREMATQDIPNLHWLDDSFVEIQGERFIGSTLWFPMDAFSRMVSRNFNDFHQIHGLEPWVQEKNAASVKYLEENVREGDIIVSHHLPTHRSVQSAFQGDPLNAFYVCDMTRTIAMNDPKLWIHGHSHHAVDYTLHGTRIYSNPVGYPDQAGHRHAEGVCIHV